MLSSGTQGDTPIHLKEAYDAGAGAVVTKSITMEWRQSNPEIDMVWSETGGWLNAVGLSNPGAKKFSEMLGRPDYPVIVSLAADNAFDIETMIGMFEGAAGFELNLSCPNVEDFDVGDDPSLVSAIVLSAKRATHLPVFVKIGHHMMEAVGAAVNKGVDGVVAINSIPATEIDPKTRLPMFGRNAGGLSGPPIKPVGLRAVHSRGHFNPIT